MSRDRLRVSGGGPPQDANDDRPGGSATAAGTPAVHLTLLSRTYCHLCDAMQAALAPLVARHGAKLAVIDVDADPALEACYGERVPVLFAGAPDAGIELCHYRLDAAAVARALDGSAAGGR